MYKLMFYSVVRAQGSEMWYGLILQNITNIFILYVKDLWNFLSKLAAYAIYDE